MNDLKNKLRKIYYLGRYPDVDWRRLFGAFLVVGVIVAGWSAYVFMQIKKSDFVLEGSTGSARAIAEIKDKELKAVINRYEAKEKRYLDLQSGNSFLPTPVVKTTTATSTSSTTSSI